MGLVISVCVGNVVFNKLFKKHDMVFNYIHMYILEKTDCLVGLFYLLRRAAAFGFIQRPYN